MKQNKIVIGPRKGLKLTKQNLIKLEKFERQKSLSSILQEESGSCKYCGLSLPVKRLKQHYLHHSKEMRAEPEPEVGSVQQPEEEREGGVILQENSISSSDSSREGEQAGVDLNTDISTTEDTIQEVPQLNSSGGLPTDSEKVKSYIEYWQYYETDETPTHGNPVFYAK